MSIESNLTRREQETLDSSLHEAVSRCNLTETARLIEARANVNSQQGLSGLTPLQMAIKREWPEGCDILLHHGADLRAIATRQDWTYLRNVALNRRSRHEQADFDRAIKNNDLEAISNLLALGIEPNDISPLIKILFESVRNKTGSPATIQLLLRQLDFPKKLLTTLTQPAISADWPELLPYLIDLGIDVNDSFHYAMQTGQKHLMKYFIDAGADKELGIIYACNMAYMPMIPTIVAAGIDANRGLQEAIKKDALEAVRVFLDHGAIPTAETLTLAMELGRTIFIEDLLVRGAIPDKNTLITALKKNNSQVLLACIDHKVVPQLELLHLAIENRNLNIVQHLRFFNSIPCQEILKIAAKKNAPEVVLCLINEGILPTEEIWNIALDTGNLNLVHSFLGTTIIPNEAVRHKILTLAIAHRDLDLFRFLLRTSNSAVLNEDLLQKTFTLAKSDNERLEFAIIGNAEHHVAHYIAAGANKDLALECAILHERPSIIAYLLNTGANKNLGLTHAITYEKAKIAHFLIDAGADKNLGLLLAVSKNNIEMAKYLLEKGAVPTVETFKLAIINCPQEFALYLLTQGITPSEEILAIAAEHGEEKVVQHLINVGIVPSLEVMREAALKSQLDIVRLLIESGGVMDEVTRSQLIERLIKEKCANIPIFLQAQRPKVDVLEVYGENGFEPASNRSKLPTKPLFILNIAKYEAAGPNYGSITQYYTPALQDVYEQIAEHFTLVRVLVDDPKKLVSTMDQAQAVFPGLPVRHWALNGHGGSSAIGLDDERFTTKDISIMAEIAKRIDRLGTISLWGCLNAESENNLASVFSQHAFQIPVFATPGLVSRVVPYTFKLKPNVAVFAPFFRDDVGQPEPMKAYRDGEEIADAYKLPARL